MYTQQTITALKQHDTVYSYDIIANDVMTLVYIGPHKSGASIFYEQDNERITLAYKRWSQERPRYLSGKCLPDVYHTYGEAAEALIKNLKDQISDLDEKIMQVSLLKFKNEIREIPG